MRTGIGDYIKNKNMQENALIAADLVRSDEHLIANIESKLYAYLGNSSFLFKPIHRQAGR